MAKGGFRGGMPMGGMNQMQMMKQAQKMQQDLLKMQQEMEEKQYPVVAAVNEAMRKAEADSAQNMSKLTGGLNLGGLFG